MQSFATVPLETSSRKARGRTPMPGVNGSQDRTFYRVRIRDGCSAAGLWISTMGKRCISSTQYCLTVGSYAACHFLRSALHVPGTSRGTGIHGGIGRNSRLNSAMEKN